MKNTVRTFIKDIFFVFITSALLLAIITNVHIFKSDYRIASSGCLEIITNYKLDQAQIYRSEGVYRPIYKNGHDPAKTKIVRYYWKSLRLELEEEVAKDQFKVTCKAAEELKIDTSWFATEHSEFQLQRIPSKP